MKNLTENYKKTLNIKWLPKNGKLSYLSGINRPINPSQVTKLAQSVTKMGIIRPLVVAELDFVSGKKTKYIIDGQHLFNALIRNGMDIPYVEIAIKDKQELIETIALLNASSKNWSLLDYICAWSSLSDDYIKLNHYYQVYDFDMGVLSSVLNNNTTDGGNITRKIKNGTFKIIEEATNIIILDNLTDVLKIIPRMNRMENRYLCVEYIRFLRNTNKYNHSKFLSGLKQNKKEFILATQEEGKLVELFTKLK